MMELVERHIKQCSICQQDDDLPLELEQLKEIIRVPHTPSPSTEERVIEEPIYVYEEEIIEEEEEL